MSQQNSRSSSLHTRSSLISWLRSRFSGRQSHDASHQQDTEAVEISGEGLQSALSGTGIGYGSGRATVPPSLSSSVSVYSQDSPKDGQINIEPQPPIHVLQSFSPQTRTSQPQPEDNTFIRLPTHLSARDPCRTVVRHAMTCALALLASHNGPEGLHWAGILAEEEWYGRKGGNGRGRSTEQLERMKTVEEGFMGAVQDEGVRITLWAGGELDKQFRGQADPWETGFYGLCDGDEEGKGPGWNDVFVSNLRILSVVKAKSNAPTSADYRNAYPRSLVDLILTLTHGLVYCFIKYLREQPPDYSHSPTDLLKQRLLPKGLDLAWDRAVFQGTLVSLKTPGHPMGNWQCGVLWFEKHMGAEDDRKGNNRGPLGARKVDFTEIVQILDCTDATMAVLSDRSDVGWVPRFFKKIPVLEDEVEQEMYLAVQKRKEYYEHRKTWERNI